MRLAARSALLLLLAAGGEAAETLELRGRIEPPPARALVAIYGAYTPFTASTEVGPDGRFRFRKLAPGSYTVSVLAPGLGEVRRTLDITPSRANRKGQVEAAIPFEPAAGTARATGVVSARELAIPSEAVNWHRRVRERLSRRDVEGAIECLERAVEIAPKYAEAWNHLGTIAYQTQRYADAEKYFRTALEAEPGAYSPTVNLGGVLINLGRPAEALGYNQRAVRERPEDALAHSQLGMSYMLTGQDERALHHLKLSKSFDSAHFSKPQLLLAEIYSRRGQRKEAAAELEEFLQLHPDAPEAAKVRQMICLLAAQ